MRKQELWKKHWAEKSMEKDPFVASGASNFAKDPFEFLDNLYCISNNLNITKQDRLLDIGCGTGLYCVALSNWANQVRAFDYIPRLVDRAKENTKSYSNIEIKKGDILKIPFRDKSFNKILINSVIQYLEHLASVKKALIEVKRVLKKNGLVFISLIPEDKQKKKYLEGIENLDLPKDKKKEIYKKNNAALWFNKKDLTALINSLNFKVSEKKVPARLYQSNHMFSLLLKLNE